MVGFSAIAAAAIPAIIGGVAKKGVTKLLGGGGAKPAAAVGGPGGLSNVSEGTEVTHQGIIQRPSGGIVVAGTADINPAWQMAKDWNDTLRNE